ncbi:MAG TPA: hypothetical protein ENJ84_12200 [Gammaproteobacteria bacterium]|nr:hypothetical protein [Gammaproteobacteria bacterium]
MKKRNLILASAMTALLSACGGESSFEEIKNNIQANLDENIQDEVKNQYLSTFSGRVADGYLVGAKVCLDINRNKACDDNEPSATTEKGGIYNLEIPKEILGKFPVIAEIIEGVTVDEDDGAPVTRKYTLTSPAGENFVSPISTLVQNEIESAPELTPAQAKKAVVKKLGLDEGVDPLSDYVSGEDKDVHALARKVAHILGDALKDVRAQVSDDGSLSDEDLNAILGVVLDEVLSKAKEINALKLEALKDGSVKPVDFSDAGDVASRIERKKIDRQQKPANFEKIAREGFYDFGVDAHCEPGEGSDGAEQGNDFKDQIITSGVIEALSDAKALDGKPECTPEVSRRFIQVDDSGKVLQTREVYQDGEWLKVPDDRTGDIRLGDEGWVTEGVQNTVEFKEDGTAVMASENGISKSLVSATITDIGSKPVRYFLPREAADFAPDRLLFSEGARSIRWSFEALNDVYEIDSWTHCDDKFKESFLGNCNVVDGYDGGNYQSLDETSLYFAPEVKDEIDFAPEISKKADGKDTFHPDANFYVGGGIGVQLFAAEEEGGNGEARYIRFSGGESVDPEENHQPTVIAAVKWERVEVKGVDMLVIGIPRAVRRFIDDPEASAFIVAHQNGFLRKGALIKSGGVNKGEHPSFNQQAMDDLEAIVTKGLDRLKPAI